MPKLPGVNHLDAVRALQKAGFIVIRQSKHIVMSNGTRQVVVPRNNPIKAFTMGGIIQDSGLTIAEFRALL
jgi:predicted RNA binding protein YcfA (HicA-like mRNA interferase family)